MPDRLTPEQIVQRLNDELSVPLSVGAQVFLAQLIAAALAAQDAEIATLTKERDLWRREAKVQAGDRSEP